MRDDLNSLKPIELTEDGRFLLHNRESTDIIPGVETTTESGELAVNSKNEDSPFTKFLAEMSSKINK